MKEVLLCQQSQFWMKESVNFVWWSKLATVTEMECIDQVVISGCFGGRLWATSDAVCKKVVVSDGMIYWNCKRRLKMGRMPNGSPNLGCSKHVQWTMHAAACHE